ncbi:MAG: hypothetical protein HDR29_00045 [Lachnospiraceae bacterium]|nr:hypothetical protein [Lachnospiraceae bacterium]
MGYKFVKNADDGEIYILPDEKESLKNMPAYLKEDESETRDIDECYETNMAIADLQKQLYKKDKELKKATRSVITVDKKNLITCFSVLGIILVLAIIIAASVINNNSSPSVIPEQNITAEVPIMVTEDSNVSDEIVSDDTDSPNTEVDEKQNLFALIDISIDEILGSSITLIISLFALSLVIRMLAIWLRSM